MQMENIKILLVDDEEEILDFLSYNLEKAGFLVYRAVSGREAIELAKVILPDIIVLDVMMPEMDGVETCGILRHQHELNDSIICFLSAKNDDITKISGFELGADDFIVKPIKPAVFIAKMKSLLRRKNLSLSGSGKIKINDLKINLDKKKVKKGEISLDLTKIEYNLLLLFVNSPDKIFSRDEIYMYIWGTAILVGDRTMDVHIRNLRKKIGPDNIRTHKGIGYSFNLVSKD
jgi:two-component system, OmpR family, alkaline phosphatase synthesis response regulator PhoP